MEMIKAAEVRIDLGREEIIRGVTFSVAGGEFFVIIGPNGSGKTTLIKGLAGTVKLKNGEIRIKGRGLAALPRRDLARTLAVVPQQMPAAFPFTVAETVLMGRSPHLGLLGIEGEKDHEIARRAMEFTDVADLARRRLSELSGGETQRAIIARALCQEPEIILLDEPTAALDPAHQIRIMDLMDRMRREKGISVIMVSHDLNLAAMYGDRILLLDHGRIVACGSPIEIMTRKHLEAVYNCRMMVEENRHTGTITATPLPKKFQS